MSLTLAELIEQLHNANYLGRKNLEQYGVYMDSSSSTYDIMDAISKINEDKKRPISYITPFFKIETDVGEIVRTLKSIAPSSAIIYDIEVE